MNYELDHPEIRHAVSKLCANFPGPYWQKCDRENSYPSEFVAALTDAGYLAALIPEKFGGLSLPLSAAAAILEEIHRSGGNAAACHAQMYTMGTLLRHGSETQKAQYLPDVASGALRLQAFGVTEPSSGTDTTSLKCTARREGDTYVVNGQKIWTSNAHEATHMFCLVRTATQGRPQQGITFLLIDMQTPGITVEPIISLSGVHEQNTVFLDNVRVPQGNRVGEEDKGWTVAKYLLEFERGTLVISPMLRKNLGLVRLRSFSVVSSCRVGGLLLKR